MIELVKKLNADILPSSEKFEYLKLKISLLLIFSILVFGRCYSQAIPSEFNKTVVFIFIRDGNDSIVPNGTGFFVSKPFPNDSTKNFVYLVTAKHVIQDSKTNKFFNEIYIRINKKRSNFDTLPLKLIVPNGVTFKAEKDIDLAIIPLAPDIIKYDYEPVPEDLLFKRRSEFDSSYVKVGTNIFYCGLFSPYLGYNSNNPIVRFGRISLLPTEEILWDNADAKQDLFLVETTTYGGNSGSPIFSYNTPFQFNGGINVGSSNVKLAGIIKGYSGEKTPVEYIKASMNLMYTSNIGITAVVPSYLLYQIIEGDNLKKLRESILENIKK